MKMRRIDTKKPFASWKLLTHCQCVACNRRRQSESLGPRHEVCYFSIWRWFCYCSQGFRHFDSRTTQIKKNQIKEESTAHSLWRHSFRVCFSSLYDVWCFEYKPSHYINHIGLIKFLCCCWLFSPIKHLVAMTSVSFRNLLFDMKNRCKNANHICIHFNAWLCFLGA